MSSVTVNLVPGKYFDTQKLCRQKKLENPGGLAQCFTDSEAAPNRGIYSFRFTASSAISIYSPAVSHFLPHSLPLNRPSLVTCLSHNQSLLFANAAALCASHSCQAVQSYAAGGGVQQQAQTHLKNTDRLLWGAGLCVSECVLHVRESVCTCVCPRQQRCRLITGPVR